ncbi:MULTISPECIES: hypothetical protein [Vibrio]|nr:hypothetical protein [Vibrio sp. 947]
MKKTRKFIKIKLLIINLLVGTGAVHVILPPYRARLLESFAAT